MTFCCAAVGRCRAWWISTSRLASRGVAVREVTLERGHGEADYLLFVDGKAAGTVEAKPEGYTLRGVEEQSRRYILGLPKGLQRLSGKMPPGTQFVDA